MQASVFIATSLDGFIARRDGSLDWLFAVAPAGEDGAEDYGYGEFIRTVDAIVMGRHTFEKVLTFGAWPYAGKQVIVLTSRALDIPAELRLSVHAMSGSPAEVLDRLEQAGASHAYVDGGQTIQRFLAAGRIDRLIVSTAPVLIGNGVPLFGPVPEDIRLTHRRTRAFSSGLVQNEYTVSHATASGA